MEHIPETVNSQQEEILQLVKSLEAFKPNKMTVEWEKDNANKLNDEYRQYFEGNLELGSHEIYQISFRLAKNLKHNKLYPFNWEGRVTEQDLAQLFSTTEKNDPKLAEKLAEFNNSLVDLESSPDKSMIDVFQQLNDPEFVRELRQIYLSFSTIVLNEEPIGVNFLTKWFEREMRIFSNVLSMTTAESDRIVLLAGSDHIWMLRQLFEGSGRYNLEEFNSYVKNE